MDDQVAGCSRTRNIKENLVVTGSTGEKRNGCWYLTANFLLIVT